MLKERDSSDPRDNRKPSGVSLRPSSVSATSRTITPSRTVQLEAQQQPDQEQPVRQVIVEEANTAKGAAPGAPDPEEGQPSAPVREEFEEVEKEEPNERSRSEPPKSRLKSLRETSTSRPLALRPRVPGYPEIRVDSVGTWALIAPAERALVTRLVGPKSSRFVNPSPKPGSEPKLTSRQWSSGPNTEFFHLGEEESEEHQSDDHRSTSSDPASVLPKRTSSQAYSHSPPPTSRDIPHSRFHQPKRVRSPRER